ncbi:hypothetical protein Salat_2117900 [Sesamum alatum]|uniref:Transposase, Ptta/En/Spm, plant n=1 Tax=Sesamum alatum TaxID=300844 RepID=A0AAE1Y0V2_9LAMI|nr:hypothetical protein Salat_2117900 [Sesamum alatum]
MSSGPGGAGGFKRIRALRSRSQVHSQDELGNSLQKDVTSLAPQHGGEQEFHTSTRLGAPSHVGSKTSLPENISSSGTRDSISSQSSLPIEGQSHSGTDDSVGQDATRSMGTRKGRGPARGHKLDIFVKRHGKYKIVFASGETIPMEFEGFRQWFDIEGWHADERVNKIIDDKFQVAYTRWRNILHQEYKKLVDQGINPREVCPRPDLSMAKWQVACDFIQDEKYQEKSRINSQNRYKMPFNHTSGKTTLLSRYRKMENMVAMQSELIDGNEDQPSEDAIMRSALGHRSEYVKGMGHGVEVVKNRQSCPSVVGNAELKEKLLELDRANDKILNLTEAYEEQRMTLEEQKKEMDACKEQNRTYSEKIDILQSQMAQMQQFLQKLPGIPPNIFTKTEDNAADDTYLEITGS